MTLIEIRGWALILLLVVIASIPNTLIAADPHQVATPTSPAEEQQAAVIIQFSMRVRAGPSSDHQQIGSARSGEQFLISGQDESGNWWRISFDGEDGWVYAPLVRSENTAQVPIVEMVAVPTFDPNVVNLGLEPVIIGLQLPVFLTHAGDGSGRIFVVEKPGRVLVYADAESEGEVFLDIRDRVGSSGNEQGLLGLAFPPNFTESGFFFVNYTDRSGATTVSRYSVTDDLNRADAHSESLVLSVAQPARNHNAGMIAFGPDGNLWIGLGDGGAANDRFGNGQNPQTRLGSMLRIDVISDPNVPYTIPADNPYLDNNGDDGILDEIWAVGLRNPWRYSFDAQTGDFWIADVGQNQYEEINFIPAETIEAGGLNFGWPIMEGTHCFATINCNPTDYFPPIFDYDHAGNGCSVTGGYVYRGEEYPILDGIYFFSDYCTGRLWALWTTEASETRSELMIPSAGTVSSFGVGESGELYVVDYTGTISKLVVE